tara:strand:+ start:208 stop:534 length:327 start_codon:yes stop_codon:yes gene_type:complete
MNISRPEATIVPSPSGKFFGVSFTHPNWDYNWILYETFNTNVKATKRSKEILKDYDDEAKELEAKPNNHTHIFGMLRDAGIVWKKKKLSKRFHKYTKAAEAAKAAMNS